jgi:OOP family OmpA-OmpF porin
VLIVPAPTRLAARALAGAVVVVCLAGCGAAPPRPSEDLDRVDDADGGPDPDDDRLADAVDLCPCVAEDPDGFDDHDGCPEPDNDRDGLLDACDQCPNEPETFQGSCDEDGCPDRSHICITQERVTIPGLVPFDASASRLAESTGAMLDTVAESLRASPEIQRVAVRGRATTRERRAAALARARAEAVVEALVQRGVDRSRLEAVGLDPATTAPAAVAGGRFVELVVVRFADEEWPEGQPPPSSTHGCGPVVCEPVPPCAPPPPPRPVC